MMWSPIGARAIIKRLRATSEVGSRRRFGLGLQMSYDGSAQSVRPRWGEK